MATLTMAEKEDSAVGKGINLLTADRPSKKFVTTYSIVDISKLTVQTMKETGMEVEALTANSKVDLAKSVSISAGVEAKFMGFSSSIKTNFESSSSSSEEKAYTRIVTTIRKRREFLTSNVTFKNYLDPEFKKELNGRTSPATLFNTYGTHFIKEAGVGGALTMSLTTEKKTSESKQSLEIKIEAGYKEVASGNTSSTTKEELKQVLSNSKLKFTPDGGKSIRSLNAENFFTEYPSWVDSVDDKPATWDFCYLPSKSALEPIWKLADSKTRRDQLEEYYNAEAAKLNNVLATSETYVGEIQIYSANSKGKASPMKSGWKKVDIDLNAGAKGNYIYIYYRTGTRKEISSYWGKSTGTVNTWNAWNGKPITGLMLVWTDKAATWKSKRFADGYGRNATYYRLGTDLNEKAGGKYIYLCYTTDENAAYHPLTAIDAYINDDDTETNILKSGEWDTVCWNNSKMPADVNYMAGGKYVFIVQKSS